MRFRIIVRSLGLVAGGLALAAPLLAQSMDDVVIETHDLGKGVAMLSGRGGNIGVSYGEDGVFLIDDQFAPLTEKILDAVEKLSTEPVRFVVNTHWHGDHTGGNENLGKEGALIVAHDNVRKRLSTEQKSALGGNAVPPSPPGALPVVTFTDAVTFHWNGETIKVLHVENAHTDGDAIIHFTNADVVHTGDTFFNGRYPVIDLGAGGSVKGLIRVADQILALVDDDTRIIPGHGSLGDKKALRAYRDMLSDIVAAMEPGVKEGQSLAEIQALKPTAKYDEVWGKATIKPEQFVETLYKDLSRK